MLTAFACNAWQHAAANVKFEHADKSRGGLCTWQKLQVRSHVALYSLFCRNGAYSSPRDKLAMAREKVR